MIFENYEKIIPVFIFACFLLSFVYAFINLAICIYHMDAVKSALEVSHLKRRGIKAQASPILTRHEVHFHFAAGTKEYDIAMKQAIAFGRAGKGGGLCVIIIFLLIGLTATGAI